MDKTRPLLEVLHRLLKPMFQQIASPRNKGLHWHMINDPDEIAWAMADLSPEDRKEWAVAFTELDQLLAAPPEPVTVVAVTDAGEVVNTTSADHSVKINVNGVEHEWDPSIPTRSPELQMALAAAAQSDELKITGPDGETSDSAAISYTWSPLADITAHELAVALPALIMLSSASSPRTWTNAFIESLPLEAHRHFKMSAIPFRIGGDPTDG